MNLIQSVIIVPDTEFSMLFVQGMAARMGTSYAKYGHVDDTSVKKFDQLRSLEARLAQYRDTGNTEWLMDVANFAMIEFMFPQHPHAHFRSTSSAESPGRVDRTTHMSIQTANTVDIENRRRGGTLGKTSGGFYHHEGD